MLTNSELLKELKQRLIDMDEQQKFIKSQSDELALLNEKLSESEKLKSHFISNITNEIINPFASILGLSENIVSSKSIDPSKMKAMAELIHSEAFELDFQLNNIFTAARFEAGEAYPEYLRTDISNVIQSVVNNYKYKAEQKQLKVKIEFYFDDKLAEGVGFITDPHKLKLIVSNLMSNGIKYSNAASKLEVNVKIDENRNLILSFKDYGIGLAKKDLSIIFDRFKRLDDAIHSLNPGHGLGLSVVKALIDSLKGEIEIKSKKGIGSIFLVTLPEGTSVDDDDFAMDGNEFIFGDGDGVF